MAFPQGVVVRIRKGSVMTRGVVVVSSGHSLWHHVEKSMQLRAVSLVVVIIAWCEA
jgi:hypothetical protein